MSRFARWNPLLALFVGTAAFWIGTSPPPEAVAGTAQANQTGTAAPADDAQIASLHQHFLGAPPSDRAFWSQLRLPANTLTQVLAASPARQNVISELYRTYLNRNLTPPEMQALASSGSSHEDLAAMVLRSAERRESIRQTYRFFMGSDPSEQDVNGWGASGMTLQAIEDQVKSGLRQAAINRMYVDYFGRAMNDYEWGTVWNPATGTHKTFTLEQVLEIIKANCAGSTERRDEIRRFYLAFLGRPADPGLDIWTATRLPLPEIATQFQNLPEGRRYLIDRLYRSYFGRGMNDFEWNTFWNPQTGTQRNASLVGAEDIIKVNGIDQARRDAIDTMWQTYFGRRLTDPEWNNSWSRNGWSLPDVERFAIHHPDARRRMIDLLWQRYLGRTLTDAEWTATWSNNQQQMPLHTVAEWVRAHPDARRYAVDVLYRIQFGRPLTDAEWIRYWEPANGQHQSVSFAQADAIVRVQYEARHHVIGEMYLGYLGRAMTEGEWAQLWDPSRGQHKSLSLDQAQAMILANRPAGMTNRQPHAANVERALGPFVDQSAQGEQVLLTSLQPKAVGTRIAPPPVSAQDGAVRLTTGAAVPWSQAQGTSLRTLAPGPAFVAATVCNGVTPPFVGPVSPSGPPGPPAGSCTGYSPTGFWSSDGRQLFPAGDATRPVTPPASPLPGFARPEVYRPVAISVDSWPPTSPFASGPSRSLFDSRPVSSTGVQWRGSPMFGDPFAPIDFSQLNSLAGPIARGIMGQGWQGGIPPHRYEGDANGRLILIEGWYVSPRYHYVLDFGLDYGFHADDD